MEFMLSDDLQTVFDTEHDLFTESLVGSPREMLQRLLTSCKALALYEYYDGVHLLVDEVPFLLTTDQDETLVYELVTEYFSTSLSSLIHLEEFSYTSRFYSEIDYSSFKDAPCKLQRFKFSTPEGLNPTFIQNATCLYIDAFDVKDYPLIPNSLSHFNVTTLAISGLSDLKTFLKRLSNLESFQMLTIEELDFNDEEICEELDSEEIANNNIDNIIRNIFNEHLPNKCNLPVIKNDY